MNDDLAANDEEHPEVDPVTGQVDPFDGGGSRVWPPTPHDPAPAPPAPPAPPPAPPVAPFASTPHPPPPAAPAPAPSAPVTPPPVPSVDAAFAPTFGVPGAPASPPQVPPVVPPSPPFVAAPPVAGYPQGPPPAPPGWQPGLQPPGYPYAPQPPQPQKKSGKGVWFALVAAFTVLAVAAGAIAFVVLREDDGETATADDRSDQSSPDDSGRTDETGPPGTRPEPMSLTLSDAIDDIEEFWTSEFAEQFGGTYEPIPEENVFPFSTAGNSVDCGPDTIPIVALTGPNGNAIYCPADDYIAWDDVTLFPRLRREFGDLSPALVMAHEWGHAIQSRADIDGPTIFVELQADCFAGAWAKRLLDGEGNMVGIQSSDIDQAVQGYLEFRDPIGTTSQDPGAHGTAFDRINGFGDGVRNGAEGCLDYFEGGITPVDIPLDPAFFETEGNLDFDQALNLFPTSLAEYWETVGEAEGVTAPVLDDISQRRDADEFACSVPEGELVESCADEEAIVWGEGLPAVHERIGDFATALVFAESYAEAQAEAFGYEVTEPRIECLAGAWTGFVFDPPSGVESSLRLSAGDLDEAIITLIELSNGDRTVFEQVGNFQRGFFEGHTACLA